MLLIPVISCLFALVGAQRLSTPNEQRSESPIIPDHDAFPLRILPLGASITWGQGSSDGNGYREHLRNLLQERGTVVDMVGTVKSGLMDDNQNEGHPGARLDQVAEWVDIDSQFRPNLVLINAGTNDVLHEDPDFPLTEISERMEQVIEDLFSRMPGVTIVVSTLLPTKDNTGNEKIRKHVNPGYKAVVESGQKENRRIVLADLYSALTKEDLIDGTHPTDKGYRKVAEAWLPAIYEAGEKKMLSEPPPHPPQTDLPPDHDVTRLSTSSSNGYAGTHLGTNTTIIEGQAMNSQVRKSNIAQTNTPTWLVWLVSGVCFSIYMI